MSYSSDSFRAVDRPMRLARLAAVFAAAILAGGPACGQDLQQKINAAVHRGRAALLPRLAAQVDRQPGDYPMGRIALSLAACLKSGVPSGSGVVKKALAKLESLHLLETYSVACYLFALDAYWQARHREGIAASTASAASGGRDGNGGRGDGDGDGDEDEDVPRVPPPGPIRKKMEDLIAWLVRGKGGTWTYGGRAHGDLSNSQFAVLGLEIGLQNAIAIPAEVFLAATEHLVKAHSSSGGEAAFNVVHRTPGWEGITSGSTRAVNYKVAPGGWTYSSDPHGEPSLTMTAAGVSSLLVARRALGQLGEYSGDLAREVDRQIAAGLAWMGTRIPGYFGNYYGMYSLEKVGDIGSIHAFGAVEWYAEGARWLVRVQKADGTWGDEVNTAFALLFLTRATRSHIQTLGPPVLFTRGFGDGGKQALEDEASDLVYVGRLKGFISAAALFGFAEESRDPKLVPILADAIKAFPPHKAHEVLARLLSLWTDDDDAISRLARSAAEEISGLKKGDRPVFEKLARDLARTRELERTGHADPEEVEGLLRGSECPVLARRALDLIDRTGIIEAFPAVIERLAGADPNVRRRAGEVLSKWTGEDFTQGGRGLPEEHSRFWREWWALHGASLVTSHRVTRIIEDLDRAREPAARDASRAALVRLGPAAVPHILAVMDRREFSIHLIRALETITGKSAGVRAADWHTALRN